MSGDLGKDVLGAHLEERFDVLGEGIASVQRRRIKENMQETGLSAMAPNPLDANFRCIGMHWSTDVTARIGM